MANSVLDESWKQTGEVLSMLYNAHYDTKKSGQLKGHDFNPYSKKKTSKRKPVGWQPLRMMFAPPPMPEGSSRVN